MPTGWHLFLFSTAITCLAHLVGYTLAPEFGLTGPHASEKCASPRWSCETFVKGRCWGISGYLSALISFMSVSNVFQL